VTDIPDKPSYKLSEVCQYTDTQPYVLRFWESEFPQLSPTRSPTGQPVYTRRDVELILTIKRMLHDEEQTIAGAREALDRGDADPGSEAQPADRADEGEVTRRAAGGNGDRATPPIVDTPTADPDSVERHRYDDALEEISLLRLQSKDLESRLRKAESTAEQARDEAERERERRSGAAQRLRQLLAALNGKGA